MSYTIEYNRQFLRSEAGLTPVWLHGDNNVWEGSGRSQRRSRNWGCFQSLIGVSEQDLMDTVRVLTGGQYQQHWMKHGKWLDDAAVLRWAKNGVVQAMTVEQLRSDNPGLSITAQLSIWGAGLEHTHELFRFINSTETLDGWIAEAKERITTRKPTESVFPLIAFSSERFKTANRPGQGKPRPAGDTVLQVTSKENNGMYVYQVTRSKCRFTPYQNAANRYAGAAAARRSINNIERKFLGVKLEPVALSMEG